MAIPVMLVVGASLGCSDDGEDESAWWEGLLAYVPAEQSHQGVDLINVLEAFQRLKIDAPADRTCIELIEDGAEDDSYAGSERDVVLALNNLGLGLSGVPGFPGETQGFIGFDSCQVELLVRAGDEYDSVGVFVPSVGVDQVEQILDEREYQMAMHDGVGYRALGDDHEKIEPFAVSGQNRVLIDGEVVVRASSHATMRAAIDASADDSAERDDEAYAMARALGEFHAATFVPTEFVTRTLDDQVGMILGTAVASDDPAEFERLKSIVIANILEPYQHWQRLPPFQRVGFAFQRTEDGTNVMKVVLPYHSHADAQAAAGELESRLTSYETIFSGDRLCESVKVEVHKDGGTSSVVASCDVERPGSWLQVMRQDTLFLVEQLPEP